MSDLTYLYAGRVRRALRLRDGVVNFDDFVEGWLDLGRDHHGVECSDRRLEI